MRLRLKRIIKHFEVRHKQQYHTKHYKVLYHQKQTGYNIKHSTYVHIHTIEVQVHTIINSNFRDKSTY